MGGEGVPEEVERVAGVVAAPSVLAAEDAGEDVEPGLELVVEVDEAYSRSTR